MRMRSKVEEWAEKYPTIFYIDKDGNLIDKEHNYIPNYVDLDKYVPLYITYKNKRFLQNKKLLKNNLNSIENNIPVITLKIEYDDTVLNEYRYIKNNKLSMPEELSTLQKKTLKATINSMFAGSIKIKFIKNIGYNMKCNQISIKINFLNYSDLLYIGSFMQFYFWNR